MQSGGRKNTPIQKLKIYNIILDQKIKIIKDLNNLNMRRANTARAIKERNKGRPQRPCIRKMAPLLPYNPEGIFENSEKNFMGRFPTLPQLNETREIINKIIDNFFEETPQIEEEEKENPNNHYFNEPDSPLFLTADPMTGFLNLPADTIIYNEEENEANEQLMFEEAITTYGGHPEIKQRQRKTRPRTVDKFNSKEKRIRNEDGSFTRIITKGIDHRKRGTNPKEKKTEENGRKICLFCNCYFHKTALSKHWLKIHKMTQKQWKATYTNPELQLPQTNTRICTICNNSISKTHFARHLREVHNVDNLTDFKAIPTIEFPKTLFTIAPYSGGSSIISHPIVVPPIPQNEKRDGKIAPPRAKENIAREMAFNVIKKKLIGDKINIQERKLMNASI